MPTLKIRFEDNDTTPDRLSALARETGLTCEEIVQRAIAEFLGGYGLKEPPENYQPKSLRELFEACGAMKRNN